VGDDNQRMNKNNTRFYEIDFLRFVAAIAVVLFHYMFRGHAEGGYNPISYAPFDQYAQYGYLGVHLFFMISGFVILLTAMKRDVVQFVISRIVRLYPAFWAGVSFTTLMIVFFGKELFTVSFPQYLSNLSMIDGYLGVEPVDGVYWTLLVELKFYALIFGILLIKRIQNIDWFLTAWLVTSLIDIVMPFPRLVQFFLLPEWAPYFASGALFYLVKLNGIKMHYIALLIASFGLSLFYANEEVIMLRQFYNTSFNALIPLSIISLFYLIFIFIITNKLSFFRATWVLKVGALTYPLYLVHQNVGFMLFTAYNGVVNKYLLLVAVFIFVLVVAWLIHQLIEKNLSAVLKRWLEKVEFKAKAISNSIG
jgi:peptidoglycan/LPS O-acetylase OafA/YrhL